MPLPRSALFSLWFNALLDGRTGPDDFAEAVRGEDPAHLVLGWPGTPVPVPLADLPASARGYGCTRAALTLPTAGDPLGLAGPPAFNADAVDLGEAVVLDGPRPLGLLPGIDARTVLWTVTEAVSPRVLDPYDEGRVLRQVLLGATAELVRLDVASWQPEIPDLLLNLAHRPGLDLPPGTPPVAVEALERADLCLEVVALARADDGGAITAHEAAARARCLTDLDVAARRAVVAFCSASLRAS
ncbi:hypothetical protein ABIE44_003832 [Marmoricola sp. OAE513]|uniref:hypothetical protein n=1 Tax=Marmoricola sp. OAE513 TaxID=2817894 RepID=UPI001AE59C0D